MSKEKGELWEKTDERERELRRVKELKKCRVIKNERE